MSQYADHLKKSIHLVENGKRLAYRSVLDFLAGKLDCQAGPCSHFDLSECTEHFIREKMAELSRPKGRGSK